MWTESRLKERKKTKNLRRQPPAAATTTTNENFEEIFFSFRDYIARKGISIGVNREESVLFWWFLLWICERFQVYGKFDNVLWQMLNIINQVNKVISK